MKLIKRIPHKYQHYGLIMIVLLFALYVVDPLFEYTNEVKTDVQVLQIRASKLNSLVSQSGTLLEEKNISEVQSEQANAWVFPLESESAFKLKIQQQLENILTTSDCNVERVGWEIATQPYESIKKWSLELKLNGNPICMAKVTRALESSQPMFALDSFLFQTRSWDGGIAHNIEATLKVSIYQQGEVG
ncbi:hypothetical protein HUZ36_07860 [Pseudoalteromonas sp. McH1-7]|uniref:hypothetical protein n=1 Tax=unclassified Pseudoalteromonas TaxID=194690 RepID=UPI0015901BE9|nr:MULTISPECIES: hypothetical protein [unclassified Pseudoalteromonas]NUZ10691.1 hypothetical protein [Pseudoalteromonas sp. McH1-7]USD29060.1 hypothetical protein J8Z24_02905 [Pseudoalteromonas sp. SCSIO 43201]